MSRNIDSEAGTSYSWLGNRFRLVKTCRVNFFVAVLIVTFFAGAMSSVIWERAYEMILEYSGL